MENTKIAENKQCLEYRNPTTSDCLENSSPTITETEVIYCSENNSPTITETEVTTTTTTTVLKATSTIQNPTSTKETTSLWSGKDVQLLSDHLTTKYSKKSGINVVVVDLCYKVMNSKKEEILLLENVNMEILPGDMIALMGPSGAGKGTLLDIIAERKTIGVWSGEILLNNNNNNRRLKSINQISAYVLQKDIAIPVLSVEESIYFAAKLKLPNFSENQLQERIELLLEMTGLKSIRASLIGNAFRKGISGGQLKRLCIAVEIVHLPDLVFLDEPTSGLDSSTSLETVIAMFNMTKIKKSVICTIHQPSVEIFQLFNKTLLLSSGRVCYFGETKNIVNYFTHPNIGYHYTDKTNISEFIIEIASGTISSPRFNNNNNNNNNTDDNLSVHLAHLFENSEYYVKRNINDINEKMTEDSVLGANNNINDSNNTSKFYKNFITLYYRALLLQIRDVQTIKVFFGKNIIIGLLSGIIYYKQAVLSEPFFINGVPSSSVSSTNSILFFAIVFSTSSKFDIIPAIASRLEISKREVKSGFYNSFCNSLVQILSPILLEFVFIWLFIIPYYFLVSLPYNVEYFFYFSFLLFFHSIGILYLGILLYVTIKNIPISLFIYALTFQFMFIMSGYSINVESVESGFAKALINISMIRWTYEGLFVKLYNSYETDDDYNSYTSGNGNVINFFGFKNYNPYYSFPIIVAYGIGFALISIVIISQKTSKLKKVNNINNFHPKTSLKSIRLEIKSHYDTNTSRLSNNNKSIRSSSGSIRSNNSERSIRSNNSERSIRSSSSKRSVPTAIQNNNNNNNSIIFLIEPSEVDVMSSPTNPDDVVVCKAEGIPLVFSNLNYSIINTLNNTNLTLLSGVSGIIMPGEMCALMGGSGAGKSTLLDILAGRKNSGIIKGFITFGSSKERDANIKKRTAYVLQEDIHYNLLTVYQTMYYAAKLRLDKNVLVEERIAIVLKMVHLHNYNKNIVGDLSGGQLKRLSIAVEILNLCDLIFLDEPTTGLDSSCSLEVINSLKILANQNRTIICTIHQPSIQIGLLFDKLLLLSNGKIIYFGCINNVKDYFFESPFQFRCDENTNILEFAISIAGSHIQSSSGIIIDKDELSDYYYSTSTYKTIQESINLYIPKELLNNNNNNNNVIELYSPETSREYNSSLLSQVKILLHRSFVLLLKEKMDFFMEVLRTLIVSFFFGGIFYKVAEIAAGSNQLVYFNIQSVLFFTLEDSCYSHYNMIHQLINDRVLFNRERNSNCYSPLAYWFSIWILQLPIVVFNILMISIPIYFLGYFFHLGQFSYFYLFLLLMSMSSLFLTLLIASISSNIGVAFNFAEIFRVQLLLGGFFVYISMLPSWVSWATNLSIVRWTFQGLVLNFFENNNEDFTLGPYYINVLGFDSINKNQCIIILCCFMSCFAILFYLSLKYLNFESI